MPGIRKAGFRVQKVRLEYGDVAFTGNGPRGEVMVGIERKTIQDLLNSITSGRLSSHQLPGMVRAYDYRWIVIEGLWRVARDGLIEVWRGGGWRPAVSRMSWHEVSRYLVTVEVRGGCWTRRTSSIWETTVLVGALFKWWGKDWKSHRGHLLLEKGLAPDRVLFDQPSYPRMVAAVLPGIGWTRSKAVAQRFKTISAMVGAGAKEWAQVDGIGKKLSTEMPLILRGYGGERSRER